MTARTVENARKIALGVAAEGTPPYIKWMSELLLDVRAEHGGLAGLSDSAFDKFCADNPHIVDRDIAMKAVWGRTITWPRTAEDEADLASWRSTWERMQARREKQQYQEAMAAE